jgi:hypothetical protein
MDPSMQAYTQESDRYNFLLTDAWRRFKHKMAGSDTNDLWEKTNYRLKGGNGNG